MQTLYAQAHPFQVAAADDIFQKRSVHRTGTGASATGSLPVRANTRASGTGRDFQLDLTITPATPSTTLDLSTASPYYLTPRSPRSSTPDGHIFAIIAFCTKDADEQMDVDVEVSLEEQLQPAAESGRRRGLLVGVRYWGSEDHDIILGGAYRDVDDMKELLISKFGWEAEEFIMLKDDRSDPGLQPTREIITRELRELVRGARSGDSLFFMFAGHGGQVYDKEGDEDDGMDEVIETCDGYQIVDDELFDLIVRPLPRGCRLTAVFDCCNSGTALDLPEIIEGQFAPPPRSRSVSPAPSLTERVPMKSRVPFRKLTVAAMDLDVTGQSPDSASSSEGGPRRIGPRRNNSHGHVVLWSACQDSEDAFELRAPDGSIRGAMSHAFIESLREETAHTYRSMLESLCTKLQRRRKHAQVPQLSGSQPIVRPSCQVH
ncbi:caspase domain-containing protein [Auriculariales sp. MPI-PUGE-AT-0066]|nr:caspase domain-containing protein [Auriculariales sp. MPI-PUGE-AT-0066]